MWWMKIFVSVMHLANALWIVHFTTFVYVIWYYWYAAVCWIMLNTVNSMNGEKSFVLCTLVELFAKNWLSFLSWPWISIQMWSLDGTVYHVIQLFDIYFFFFPYPKKIFIEKFTCIELVHFVVDSIQFMFFTHSIWTIMCKQYSHQLFELNVWFCSLLMNCSTITK